MSSLIDRSGGQGKRAHGTLHDSMHHHLHPYALQDASFFFALIPIVMLFVIVIGAQFFDGLRRARKPLPARAFATLPLLASPRLLPTPD